MLRPLISWSVAAAQVAVLVAFLSLGPAAAQDVITSIGAWGPSGPPPAVPDMMYGTGAYSILGSAALPWDTYGLMQLQGRGSAV